MLFVNYYSQCLVAGADWEVEDPARERRSPAKHDCPPLLLLIKVLLLDFLLTPHLSMSSYSDLLKPYSKPPVFNILLVLYQGGQTV